MLTREEDSRPSPPLSRFLWTFLGRRVLPSCLEAPTYTLLSTVGPTSQQLAPLLLPSPCIYKFRTMVQIGDTASKTLKHTSVPSSKFICNMSGKCDNCDCADSSQCTKKGKSYDLVIVETENRSMDTVVVDAPAAENDGKCKCGTVCLCVNCTCGH